MSIKRRVQSIFLGGILLGLSLAPAGASAPALLTYQGRLKQTGLPVNGTRSVDIQLCPLSSGGSCTSTGAQDVQVTNGLFRTTFTVPSTIDWTTGDWYLEIVVDASPFSPREKLASAPYAIYASSATTLVPNPGQTTVFISSSVSIGGSGFSVGGSTLVVSGGDVDINGRLSVGGTGHVRVTGSAPTVDGASCGATASVTGSDGAGRITLGDPAGSNSCQLNFSSAWSPTSPVCVFTNETQNQFLRPTLVSSTRVIFSAAVPLTASDTISYICVNY